MDSIFRRPSTAARRWLAGPAGADADGVLTDEYQLTNVNAVGAKLPPVTDEPQLDDLCNVDLSYNPAGESVPELGPTDHLDLAGLPARAELGPGGTDPGPADPYLGPVGPDLIDVPLSGPNFDPAGESAPNSVPLIISTSLAYLRGLNSAPAALTPALLILTSVPLVLTSAPLVLTPAPLVLTSVPLVLTSAPAALTPAPLVLNSTPLVLTPAPAALTPAPLVLNSTPLVLVLNSTPADPGPAGPYPYLGAAGPELDPAGPDPGPAGTYLDPAGPDLGAAVGPVPDVGADGDRGEYDRGTTSYRTSREEGTSCEPSTPGQSKKRARTQDSQILAFKQKHSVRPIPTACLNRKCRFECTSHISQAQRENINTTVNSLPRDARLQWYATHVTDETPTLTDSPPLTDVASARRRLIVYRLPLENGRNQRVCKEFCLTTMGFSEASDGVVLTAVGKLSPKRDERGRASPAGVKLLATELKQHIERYHPLTPHYRYLHAPNRRYLPIDLSVPTMYRHLVEEKGRICSMERFRQAVREANIGFTRLAGEECEICKAFHLHLSSCTDHETCQVCQDHASHLDRAERARAEYARDRSRPRTADEMVVSADMMRIAVLPILPHKTCVFTSRLIAYNETFVSLGGGKGQGVCIVWHEGVAGRDAPDVASTFMKFAELHRHAASLTFWVDNCSAQNKNWTFLTALQNMVNRTDVALNTVTVKYLEKGHTSMSADAIHQVVNKFLSKAVVEDFSDFVKICERSGRVVEMSPGDFRDLVNGVSTAKLTRLAGGDMRPMLRDIKVVQARRGDDRLFLKTRHGSPSWAAYDLFKTTYDPTTQPNRRAVARGVNKDKLDRILKVLAPLMTPYKREFWESLQGNKVRDLAG